MNLSKSKYCNGIQCKKMLWLDKYKNEEKEDLSNDSALENGKEVGILAKKLFDNRIDNYLLDIAIAMVESKVGIKRLINDDYLK